MYGAPNSAQAKKLMILGSGELGKEVIIEAQRLGVETIAVDRYANAPAMQVAHRSHVIDMMDTQKLREVIEKEKPDVIVPEVEAIDTNVLLTFEENGTHIVPTAQACQLTMNREGIRRLAAEQLQLPTAKYAFASTLSELKANAPKIGFPCVIKPIMSSSGKGQSVCHSFEELTNCWNFAMEGARAKLPRVIIEEFIHFDFEITLLTVRSISGTTFCPPIGHIQKDGDYIESWQPQPMRQEQLEQAQAIAEEITEALGGYGIYGVELFVGKDQVWFSEVSPRPHDTGMVTMVSQDLSEFALHVRAILGFPVHPVNLIAPGATRTLKADHDYHAYRIVGTEEALQIPHTQVRIFGKPNAYIGRRMAVSLATGPDIEIARKRADDAIAKLRLIEDSLTYNI